jgi:hypothetical protein
MARKRKSARRRRSGMDHSLPYGAVCSGTGLLFARRAILSACAQFGCRARAIAYRATTVREWRAGYRVTDSTVAPPGQWHCQSCCSLPDAGFDFAGSRRDAGRADYRRGGVRAAAHLDACFSLFCQYQHLAAGRERPDGRQPEAPAPPVAGLQARVASGDLSNLSTLDGIDPDHMGHGCVPEPASMILMTSGVLGLIVARRRKRQDGL